MDYQQRGRSPSTGVHNRISLSRSPSPNPYQQHISGIGLDPTLSSIPSTSNSSHNPQPSSFDIAQQYLNTSQSQQFAPNTTLADNSFLQTQDIRRSASPQLGQQGNNLFQDSNLIDPNNATSLNGNFDAQLYPGNSGTQDASIDPSFLDPELLNFDPQQPPNQNIDPSNLMNQMASTQQSPTPPHFLTPNMHQTSGGSQQGSPALSQGGFPSPHQQSRPQSLDPAIAYQQGGLEWGPQFRGHRRVPSDTHSDVSSSAFPSPNIGHQESFDGTEASPMLNPQQDQQMFPDLNNFQQFNLNDNGIPTHISQQNSPHHSPSVSPRLLPQQHSLPPFTPSNHFGLAPGMNTQYGQQGLEMFPGVGSEPFPATNGQSGQEFGAANAMSPPEINIDFAPPSRQPTANDPNEEPHGPQGALSPPDRCT